MSEVQWPTADATPSVEPVAETEEQFVLRRDGEISAWLEAKAALSTSKDAENQRRIQLSATLFKNPKKGTNRYALNNGFAIKLVHGWNYTLGDKDLTGESGLKIPVEEQVKALEERIQAVGVEGRLLCSRLIRWKPELVPAEYERLNQSTASEEEIEIKTLIDELLKVSPATPALTFEEPKGK